MEQPIQPGENFIEKSQPGLNSNWNDQTFQLTSQTEPDNDNSWPVVVVGSGLLS